MQDSFLRLFEKLIKAEGKARETVSKVHIAAWKVYEAGKSMKLHGNLLTGKNPGGIYQGNSFVRRLEQKEREVWI